METEINLQKYFLSLDKTEYTIPIHNRLEEPFKSLLEDIGYLLETNIFLKEIVNLTSESKCSFDKLHLTNNGEYINCILSAYNIEEGKNYIQIAKKIAQFFNEEFPFEVKDLNIGLPKREELRGGYEMRDENENILYSAGICLANDLCEIRFTIYKG